MFALTLQFKKVLWWCDMGEADNNNNQRLHRKSCQYPSGTYLPPPFIFSVGPPNVHLWCTSSLLLPLLIVVLVIPIGRVTRCWGVWVGGEHAALLIVGLVHRNKIGGGEETRAGRR